jgi:hypothetical protein
MHSAVTERVTDLDREIAVYEQQIADLHALNKTNFTKGDDHGLEIEGKPIYAILQKLKAERQSLLGEPASETAAADRKAVVPERSGRTVGERFIGLLSRLNERSRRSVEQNPVRARRVHDLGAAAVGANLAFRI